MKNQAQLVTKKPPTKLKTEVNIYNKKEGSGTSVESKVRLAANGNQNSDSSLKKRYPYSPRNEYQSKPYNQGRTDKIEEFKKQPVVIKNKSPQLNNEQVQSFPLLKSKSSSQYKRKLEKSSIPTEAQSPKLESQQLKSRVSLYQKQILDLQAKIIRLETQIKQKENSKVNYDYKLDTQKFIQISNLKQELSAAGYRQRSLTDQKKVLIQNQLHNQKKIEELQLLLIKQRKERDDHDRNRYNPLQQSKANQRRLIDRHTEIIRSKQKQIARLKNVQYSYKDKVLDLQNQIYKLKIVITDRPFPNIHEIQKEKQSLKNEVQRLNFQLQKQYQKKHTSISQSRSQKNNLQKQISNYLKEIHSLMQKNQQWQRSSIENNKVINQLQTKNSKLELLKFEESKKVIEMTAKCSKLQQQLLSHRSSNLSNININVSKSMQSLSKPKHDDHSQHNSTINSNSNTKIVQKLQTANKSLQASVANCHQLQKKLKMNQSLLHESNGCIMKMRLQMMNRMYAQFDSK